MIVQEQVLFLGGLILLLFGVIALSMLMFNLGFRALGIAGLALDVAGISLFLPFTAMTIVVYPTLGQFYLSGHPDISTLMGLFSPRHLGVGLQTQLFLMLFVSIAGAIATGVAIWRSGRFPQWVGVAYALAFSLTITDLPVVAWVGLILLVTSGGMVAARSNVAMQRRSRGL